MFASALLGPAVMPRAPSFRALTKANTRPSCTSGGGGGSGLGLSIECSSRPQKKATAHHMKTRPKKTQPWDVKRKPTVYAPLPPLPPDWTVVSSSSSSADDGAEPGSGSSTAEAPASTA